MLGQTVEAYGHDLPEAPDLGDLMAEISDIERLRRIRFLTSYPRDMTHRILEAVARLPKVMECFSLPVQAGSDAVLHSMRRGYTRAQYLETAALLREHVPGLALTTDIIVGYPGETEAEMEQTVRLALDLNPSYASFHLFTPYPGTDFAVPVGDGSVFVPPTHPDALPFERLSALRRSAYLRFYLRPRYVMSRLARREYASLLRQARIFLSQVA